MLDLGGVAWEIQMLGMKFVVLWSHSLGGSIGEGSAEVGLEWWSGTCQVFPLHICKDKMAPYRILRTIKTKFNTPVSYQTDTAGVREVRG